MSSFSKYKVHSKEECWNFIKQFVKFGLVGVSNTVISLAVYYGLLYLGVHYLIANTVGFIVSVLNAYYWNKKYVFKNAETKTSKVLLKTYVSYGSTFLLGTGLMFVMVHYLRVPETVAPIINLLVTIPLNFLLNKFWAFK